MQMKTNIAIIGGGNSTHVLIPFITAPGKRKISLLTSKPSCWSRNIVSEWQQADGTVLHEFHGVLDAASCDAREILPDADIIILCMPVHKYNLALDAIAPFISRNKKVLLGTIYGQGGFNWMVERIRRTHGLDRISGFAVGLIPWIARTKNYGSSGITYGPKTVNIATFDDSDEFEINSEFLDDLCFSHFQKGKFRLAENFLSLSLSVDNQIIHPSRLYGLYKRYGGNWRRKEDIPLFYRDYDELSAELLQRLDDDYSKIRKSVQSKFPGRNYEYMLNYLDLERLSYRSCSENIRDSFVNSETLGTILTPVILTGEYYEFDKNHRFFHDDIYYGLAIAKWFAERFELRVECIDEILLWAEVILGDRILDNDRKLDKTNSRIRTPDYYGLHDDTYIFS